MRSDVRSEGGSRRALRAPFRFALQLAAAPVFLAVGLVVTPFIVVGRLLGFEGPRGRFAHGKGGRGRGCRPQGAEEPTATEA